MSEFTEVPIDRDLTSAEEAWVMDNIASKEWRMSHLYRVRHDGKLWVFKPRPMQRVVLYDPHPMKLLLKERGEGGSTAALIHGMDRCLFEPNTKAASIAGRKEDSDRLFREKVQTAYEYLPKCVLNSGGRQLKNARYGNYFWENGSSLFTSVSTRTQRLNYLHISEFGLLSLISPRKAKEVVEGSIQSLLESGECINESTAEGDDGYFYAQCMNGLEMLETGIPLTRLDWKLIFAKWYEHADYKLDNWQIVHIPDFMQRHFDRLKSDFGITLPPDRMAWYTRRAAALCSKAGDLSSGLAAMKRQYPSHPREAFESAVNGAYFAEAFEKVIRDGRITKVPHQPGIPVNIWFDIGSRDLTTIWFTQDIGRSIHVIRYFEVGDNAGFDGAHAFLEKCKAEHGYKYGLCYLPHDGRAHEWLSGKKSRQEVLASFGYNVVGFNTLRHVTVRKPTNPQEVEQEIEYTRRIIDYCFFDEEATREGVRRLKNFRREWSEKRGWTGRPLHDKANNSDAASSFRLIGVYHTWDNQPTANVVQSPFMIDYNLSLAVGTF